MPVLQEAWHCRGCEVEPITSLCLNSTLHEICMHLVRAILAGLALCAVYLPGVGVAQDFPARPVRLIVPLSPGSAFDLLARAMGEAFKARTQQPFIVENRPGGNMAIAANACKAAPPD